MNADSRRLSDSCCSTIHNIPANALRVVQDLKEIVKSSEDEIYYMLRECDMDPNETVQRLLNEDTFHEVKRKRDRKKENVNKEASDIKPKVVGLPYVRDVKVSFRSNGWTYQNASYSDFSGGGRRAQSSNGSENGITQKAKSFKLSIPALSTTSQPQMKPSSPMTSSTTTNMQEAGKHSLSVTNSNSSHTNISQTNYGGRGCNAGSRQPTMAEVVKSTHLFKSAIMSNSKGSSEVLIPSSPNSRSNSTPQTLNCRSAIQSPASQYNDESQNSERLITTSVPDSLGDIKTSPEDAHLSSIDGTFTTVEDSVPASEELQANGSCDMPSFVQNQDSTNNLKQSMDIREGYSPKHKSESESSVLPPSPNNHCTTDNVADNLSDFQDLSIKDDKPVIIPDHLQVPEVTQTQLSFGTFRDDCAPAASSTIVRIDDTPPLENEASPKAPPPDNCVPLSPTCPISSSIDKLDITEASEPTCAETICSTESTASSLGIEDAPNTSSPSQPGEGHKPVPIPQQLSQDAYLLGAPHYAAIGMSSQFITPQLSSDTVDNQQQGLFQLPRLMSPPTDDWINYYSPLLRTAESETAYYNHYIPTDASTRLNSGPTSRMSCHIVAQQAVGIPQSCNPGLQTSRMIPHFLSTNIPVKPNLANSPTLQMGAHSFSIPYGTQVVGIPQSGQTVMQAGHSIPQQPVPVQTYPTQNVGIPTPPVSANIVTLQCIPPNYGYVPSPYHQSFPLSTGYPHGHTFSSYASMLSPPFFPSGTMKYAYKPGMNTTPGYEGSILSQSGYGTVSTPLVMAPGYNAMSPTSLKENMHLPSVEQGEGTTVWIQAPISHDMVRMQSSSVYALVGQDQPAYPQSVASTVPAYTVYQSNIPSAFHQLHPQSLQNISVVGATVDVGANPQAHGQNSWTSPY